MTARTLPLLLVLAWGTAHGSPLKREVMVGDVVHYSVVLRVGSTPHAQLTLHRVVRESSPGHPRRTQGAILLAHGDFSTFATNFAPSLASDVAPPERDLAVSLARQGIDVWGFDRRWTSATVDDPDFADFATMTMDEAIADTERALGFARLVRALGGDGWGRMILGGYSSGAHLAYRAAAADARRPAVLRQIDGLLPIDVYAAIAPEDEEERLAACARRDEEQAAIDAGYIAGENGFFALMGQLYFSAPDDVSPIFGSRTNRGAILFLGAQTYRLLPVTPFYHWTGATFGADGRPSGFVYTDERRIAAWLAGAVPYQSMAESRDSDALQCEDDGAALADIEVPLLLVGATGGYGSYGLYTTTRVGSTDVEVKMVELPDFGHADLLFADAAEVEAWSTMAEWIRRH